MQLIRTCYRYNWARIVDHLAYVLLPWLADRYEILGFHYCVFIYITEWVCVCAQTLPIILNMQHYIYAYIYRFLLLGMLYHISSHTVSLDSSLSKLVSLNIRYVLYLSLSTTIGLIRTKKTRGPWAVAQKSQIEETASPPASPWQPVLQLLLIE